MIRKRRPVLFIDDGDESKDAIALFENEEIDYLKYHIKNFEQSCCGDVPTTITPSVFAPEGVYKGLKGVKEYVKFKKSHPVQETESESAYW